MGYSAQQLKLLALRGEGNGQHVCDDTCRGDATSNGHCLLEEN